MPITKHICKYCGKEYKLLEKAKECEMDHERIHVGNKELNLNRFKIEAHLLEGEYLFIRDVYDDPQKSDKGPVVYKRIHRIDKWNGKEAVEEYFEGLE